MLILTYSISLLIGLRCENEVISNYLIPFVVCPTQQLMNFSVIYLNP